MSLNESFTKAIIDNNIKMATNWLLCRKSKLTTLSNEEQLYLIEFKYDLTTLKLSKMIKNIKFLKNPSEFGLEGNTRALIFSIAESKSPDEGASKDELNRLGKLSLEDLIKEGEKYIKHLTKKVKKLKQDINDLKYVTE